MSELLFEPLAHFPECHANCLLPLADGRMLCVYFAGAHEKANDVEFSYPSLAIADDVLHLGYTYHRRAIADWHARIDGRK